MKTQPFVEYLTQSITSQVRIPINSKGNLSATVFEFKRAPVDKVTVSKNTPNADGTSQWVSKWTYKDDHCKLPLWHPKPLSSRQVIPWQRRQGPGAVRRDSGWQRWSWEKRWLDLTDDTPCPITSKRSWLSWSWIGTNVSRWIFERKWWMLRVCRM